MNAALIIRTAVKAGAFCLIALFPVMAEAVVFDVDLTKGQPSPGDKIKVNGGAWDNGWLPKANRDQMVFNAGYKIKNGFAEVTVKVVGNVMSGDKIHWYSVYESAGLHMNDPGSKAMARTGQTKYGFSRIKWWYKSMSGTKGMHNLEPTVGSSSVWKTGNTITARFEWKNGIVKFVGSGGGQNVDKTAHEEAHGNQWGNIQYVCLGTDNKYFISLKGGCFTSVKLVDFDGDGPVAAQPEMTIRSGMKSSSVPHQAIMYGPSGRILGSRARPAAHGFGAYAPGYYLLRDADDKETFGALSIRRNQ